MIARRRWAGKGRPDKFAKSRWDRTSPEWRRHEETLEEDHLARLIDRGVDQLDLTPLYESFSGRGSKACPPDLMLKVVLFEIQRGRASPAQWHRDAKENIAVQWLAFGTQPSRSVWYQFEFRVRPYLDQWSREVLQQAQDQELTSGQRAALDGSTVEANASRHRLLNMEQVEQRRQLLADAIAADQNGEPLTKQPYWMAKTAETRRRQSSQYKVAQSKLAERLTENNKKPPSRRREAKNVRISVTDPDAVLGKDKQKVFRPLYNVQYVRDLDSPFILAYDVFARNNDAGTFVPMMERTRQLTGHLPKDVLADCGYVTALDLADAHSLDVQLYGPWRENDYSDKETAAKTISKDEFTWDEQTEEYRCPQGQPLKLRGTQNRKRFLERVERLELYQADAAACAKCPLKERCCPKSKSGRHVNRSEHEELIAAHRRKMETPEAKALYKLRRQTVEPSFGDSKQHRGFRRINGRGLWKAKIQTALTVLAHNLKELVRATMATGTKQRRT